MVDVETVRGWRGRTMVDRDGDRIGIIEDIYADDRSGQPEWALVNTGLFGTRSTFVPLAQAGALGDQVQVPYQKQLIKDAPNIDPDQHLSESEERQLWRHYGLEYADTGRTTADADRAAVGDRDSVGQDVTGPTTDDAMTRSEEELRVGTQARERGRVRLDTETVTDERRVAEEVRKEQIEVEGDQDQLRQQDRR